jgi:MFS transporter, PAT family, beta-lactamase induction signal transducer AmpG
MQQVEKAVRGVWWWVPSLYFSQGLPYVAVMTMSVVFYKNMGISNTDIALYTSWLYLPFVIKPLWSPFVDMFRTKRWWIITMQLLIGSAFALVALVIPMANYFQLTLAFFWLLAFSAATHDIATDGFYMLSLKQHQQAAYVGARSMFFRMAMLTGQGVLVYLAGRLTELSGNTVFAWSVVFLLLAAMFLSLFLYHRLVLPVPVADHAVVGEQGLGLAFLSVFRKFLAKKDISRALLFMLMYRFGESQLVKLAPPFLLDSNVKGGLGLSTAHVGIVYGSIGIVALTVGGLLGSYLIARDGLKRWLWPMAMAINVPHLVYVYLALALPTNLYLIGVAVAFEQLGYGFGFTAYILFMIMTADGEHKTAHYAICAGFMAMGMMLPGMFSGWIQASVGYANFFIWVCAAAIPCFIATALIKVDPGFGKE